YSLLHKLRRRGDGYTRSVNYEATTGTFCTEEPSGAVVKHDPNSLSTRNTVFAFTQMLGASYNSKGIHPRERGPLNNKLIECQKYSKLK
ncbi:hypothetical protein MTO96_037599, partial [Rhipicephalus appendiculatus]